jgi:hypothetical protein
LPSPANRLSVLLGCQLDETDDDYKTHEPAPAVNDIKLDQIQFDPFKDETIEADTSGVKLDPDIPPFVPAANRRDWRFDKWDLDCTRLLRDDRAEG